MSGRAFPVLTFHVSTSTEYRVYRHIEPNSGSRNRLVYVFRDCRRAVMTYTPTRTRMNLEQV